VNAPFSSFAGWGERANVEFPEFLEGFKERHRAWFGGVQSYTRPPETPKKAISGPLESFQKPVAMPVLPLDAKARASGEDSWDGREE
jgi:hypothetical protein